MDKPSFEELNKYCLEHNVNPHDVYAVRIEDKWIWKQKKNARSLLRASVFKDLDEAIASCQQHLLTSQLDFEKAGIPPALYCGILIQVATHIAFKNAGTQAQAEHTLREYLKASLHLEREQKGGKDE